MRRRLANSVLVAIRIVTIGAIASTFLLARTEAQAQSPPPEPYVALGFEILSPTEGFDFAPYVKRLLTVVKRNWMKQMPEDARMGEKGTVAVVVTIQKDGTLAGQGPTTDVDSRYKDMDRAALEAVRASAPFERLPDGFKGTELKLRATFFYNVSPPLKH
jgi:TonB family protein